MAVRVAIGAPRATPRRRSDRPRVGAIVAGAICALLLAALSVAWNLWLAPGRGHVMRAQDAAAAREFERAAAQRGNVIRHANPQPGTPDV